MPNRNDSTEDYNNWNKKLNRGVQQQTWWSKRKGQQIQRQGSGINQMRAAKRKRMSKCEDSLRDLKAEQHSHYRDPRRRRHRKRGRKLIWKNNGWKLLLQNKEYYEDKEQFGNGNGI